MSGIRILRTAMSKSILLTTSGLYMMGMMCVRASESTLRCLTEI